MFCVIGEHVNFSWNKKSCKFYSKQLGEYPYHTSYTIKGLPLVGLLDQWVGLRKVFVGTCLAAKLDKSKRQEWPFKLLPLSSKATKSSSKFSLGLSILNGKFGGDSPVVFKLYFQWQQGGVHSEKNGWKILFFWLFSMETKRWGPRGGGCLW